MKTLKKSSIFIALLLGAVGAQAQVGVLQGTVTGVEAGTVLPVFKGEAKVADIKVEAGGKFSVALPTGVYTVNCPNGKVAKVAALNGAATISINCQ
jgi:L-cystine uptake protein TcyP (sodium:dicarboxylate symporter family)